MINNDWYAHYDEQETWFDVKESDIIFPNHEHKEVSEVTLSYIKQSNEGM